VRREGRTGEQPLPPEAAEENVDPSMMQTDLDPSQRPRDVSTDTDIITEDDGSGDVGGWSGGSGGGSSMPGHPDAAK
jgi:hypothetical protein